MFLDLLIVNFNWLYFWITNLPSLIYMTWSTGGTRTLISVISGPITWRLTGTENLIPQPDQAKLGSWQVFDLVFRFYHKVMIESEPWVDNLSLCANLLGVLNPWGWGLLSWGVMVCAMTSWWSWESDVNCWLCALGWVTSLELVSVPWHVSGLVGSDPHSEYVS